MNGMTIFVTPDDKIIETHTPYQLGLNLFSGKLRNCATLNTELEAGASEQDRRNGSKCVGPCSKSYCHSI